ncbi:MULTISPECIES: DMT family transporter [unclassified Arthrobacter]|uniref:DMT family transporter n=1 Tax=unclassified Arthrobacter TaxID=235627 RepID=UPI001D15B126|nr:MULTISPECIES: DMT family transporter [unclassified Arthrobacter]MCC3277030.1 DMT family transporter [Arthrobacter sp. zg-Y20]MCC3280643.1 DMT family transporter [Arthrobacter sp. zg-Y40]MCC9178898.1 DMT family transporter [Arthrobacter sp. zg-Y750]MDK1317191.1 DMT family transporter [Arthrobacter sp. zg.Y20]MDK1328943.1 DMT family transporter [Arthrobacter sp. zg-Y1143]
MVGIAVACALASAFFLAFGAQRQGSAVSADTGGLALNSSGFTRLLRNPRWLFGLLLLGIGMGLNVAALSMAPLTVVQPIGSLALVITTVVNSRDQGLRLNRITVAAIAACVAGSMLFVSLAIAATRSGQPVDSAQEVTIVLILAVVVVFFGGLNLLFGKRLKAIAHILGAGILFGFVAVLTKVIIGDLLNPNGRFLWNVPWYTLLGIAVAGALGSWFVQNAYSSGPPDLVIAGLTVIDPMVGIAIGIGVLNELRPDVPAVTAVAMAVAGLIAIVGVVALSRYHPDVIQRRNEERRRQKLASKTPKAGPLT